MAGTQLLCLLGPAQVAVASERFANPFAAVAVNHDQRIRRQLARGGDDPAEHRLTTNRVQDFRQVGIHAFAATGGKNDGTERVHFGFNKEKAAIRRG